MENKRWLKFLHITFAVTFVCAPSHLAPGVFLGPTGRGVRWFLLLRGKRPFISRVKDCSRLTPTRLGHHSVHSFWARTAWFGCVAWKTIALFANSLVQELFFFFCLLVALSLLSGDVKLCQECVIVDSYDELPHWRSTTDNIFSIFGFILHNLNECWCVSCLIRKKDMNSLFWGKKKIIFGTLLCFKMD